MDKMVVLLTILLFSYNTILAIIVGEQTYGRPIFVPLLTFILLDYFILFYFADKVVSQVALKRLFGSSTTRQAKRSQR